MISAVASVYTGGRPTLFCQGAVLSSVPAPRGLDDRDDVGTRLRIEAAGALKAFAAGDLLQFCVLQIGLILPDRGQVGDDFLFFHFISPFCTFLRPQSG